MTFILYYIQELEHLLTQFLYTMGFSIKKIYPSPLVEDINFFEVDSPGFPVNFIMTPLEFSTDQFFSGKAQCTSYI